LRDNVQIQAGSWDVLHIGIDQAIVAEVNLGGDGLRIGRLWASNTACMLWPLGSGRNRHALRQSCFSNQYGKQR
jgi:hypothetical protein